LSRLLVLGIWEKGPKILFTAVQDSLPSAGHRSSWLAVLKNGTPEGCRKWRDKDVFSLPPGYAHNILVAGG
jgi:hypothetical protein